MDMKFRVGDRVVTTSERDIAGCPLFPLGTIGTIVGIDKDDPDLPYEVQDEFEGDKKWYEEHQLAPISERSKETEMPKQKDLYNFDNMTDDDLEMLINKANKALINKRKVRLMSYLDDALNALRNFQALDHNTAMTSEGNTVDDIIYNLEDLENYYS